MNDIKSNGLVPIIAQALDVMKAKAGHDIPLEKINLAELSILSDKKDYSNIKSFVGTPAASVGESEITNRLVTAIITNEFANDYFILASKSQFYDNINKLKSISLSNK